MRRIALALLLAALALTAVAAAGDVPHPVRLKAVSFDPLEGLPDLPAELRYPAEPAGGYFIVQFRGEADRPALERVKRAGAEPLEYVADRAYIVRLAAGSAPALRALDGVRWLGPIEPGFKLAPDLGVRPYADPAARSGGLLRATIDLFAGEDVAATAHELEAAGLEVSRLLRFADTRRLEVRATLGQLHHAARLPAVEWIEEVAEITPRNNTATWVVQTDVTNSRTVWAHGLHGEGQIIGHIDGPLDVTSCYFRDPVNNTPGPAHRKVIAYRSSSGLGADFHGTHTAGTAAGDQSPLNGTTDGNGHAYAAKLSHSNLDDITGSGTASSNLYDYLAAAHADGARVHTNSWGDDGTTAYTTWCRDIDRFAYDFEDSLVLFASTNTTTLKTPENAKNLLAVGASQNGVNDDGFCSGGTGPTSDGRRKPEIFAPGCGIQSARSSQICMLGTASGTSMASPAVTGAAALVRQYFTEGWYPSGTKQSADARVPSAALLKAMLLDSTTDMTNIAGYPSNQEGWGRVLLENVLYFAGDLRNLDVLADVRNATGLATGQTDAFAVTVTSGAEELKLTLAYTEPPAALLAGQATVNNLDLELTSPSGVLYRGNVFNAGASIPGGSADTLNNVEVVRIASPEAGAWAAVVRASAVNQGLQGYALVATGRLAGATGGSVRYAGHGVVDPPPLGNGNGVADPGETITLPLTLLNLRPTAATAVSARLFSTDGHAQVLGASSAFSDIQPSGTATSLAPQHRLTIAPSAACGVALPFDVEADYAQGADASSFPLAVGAAELVQSSSEVPRTIPAVSATGVSSTLTIGSALTIGDVNVTVNITHANVGQFRLTLRSPQNTTVTLHDHSHGGTANLNVTYDAQRVPDGPGSMSNFDGQSAQGTWTLTVIDDQTGIPLTPAGTLDSWSLAVRASTGAVCQPMTCPGDPVPGAVAPALVVAIVNGSDLRFTWPAVAGAEGYRVWRSDTRDFAHAELVGTSSTPSFTQPGGLLDPRNSYFRVRAVNGCEWEGP